MLNEHLFEHSIVLDEAAKVGDRATGQSTPGKVQVPDARVGKRLGDDFHASIVEITMREAEPLHKVMVLANVHDRIRHAFLVHRTHGLFLSALFFLLEMIILKLRISLFEVVDPQIVLAKADSSKGRASFERGAQSLHDIVL